MFLEYRHILELYSKGTALVIVYVSCSTRQSGTFQGLFTGGCMGFCERYQRKYKVFSGKIYGYGNYRSKIYITVTLTIKLGAR